METRPRSGNSHSEDGIVHEHPVSTADRLASLVWAAVGALVLFGASVLWSLHGRVIELGAISENHERNCAAVRDELKTLRDRQNGIPSVDAFERYTIRLSTLEREVDQVRALTEHIHNDIGQRKARGQ